MSLTKTLEKAFIDERIARVTLPAKETQIFAAGTDTEQHEIIERCHKSVLRHKPEANAFEILSSEKKILMTVVQWRD